MTKPDGITFGPQENFEQKMAYDFTTKPLNLLVLVRSFEHPASCSQRSRDKT